METIFQIPQAEGAYRIRGGFYDKQNNNTKKMSKEIVLFYCIL